MNEETTFIEPQVQDRLASHHLAGVRSFFPDEYFEANEIEPVKVDWDRAPWRNEEEEKTHAE
jgi:hypothetical protein